MTVRFIGIVCGLKSEAAALPVDPRLRIAISGADAGRAEKLAYKFCEEGAAAILSVGVSGGLSPVLAPGDLLLGSAVITGHGEEFISSTALLAAMELENAAIRMQRATLYGSDSIVASAHDKAGIFMRTGAVAVDMESHGAARAAKAAAVPFVAIRAVADPASRALPRSALGAVAPDGSTRVLKTLLECAKAPGDFPALLQLGADSSTALKTLRVDFRALLRRLFLSLNL